MDGMDGRGSQGDGGRTGSCTRRPVCVAHPQSIFSAMFWSTMQVLCKDNRPLWQGELMKYQTFIDTFTQRKIKWVFRPYMLNHKLGIVLITKAVYLTLGLDTSSTTLISDREKRLCHVLPSCSGRPRRQRSRRRRALLLHSPFVREPFPPLASRRAHFAHFIAP